MTAGDGYCSTQGKKKRPRKHPYACASLNMFKANDDGRGLVLQMLNQTKQRNLRFFYKASAANLHYISIILRTLYGRVPVTVCTAKVRLPHPTLGCTVDETEVPTASAAGVKTHLYTPTYGGARGWDIINALPPPLSRPFYMFNFSFLPVCFEVYQNQCTFISSRG